MAKNIAKALLDIEAVSLFQMIYLLGALELNRLFIVIIE